jgi:hypothetical protein
MHKFGYNQETIFSKELDIDELGQVALEAKDSESMFYYLIIRTSLGQSSIVEYGPVVPDIAILPDFTEIKFQRVDFNELKIKQIIKRFLMPRNKGKNKIEDVIQINVNDAVSRGINILEYIKNFDKTSNY